MATRYWRGTTNNNWNNTGNWSDTSGGATGFSFPTIADDVFVDASFVNGLTVNVASAAKSIAFTGYTGTLTVSNTLTVGGNVTLVAAMTITGTGTLLVNATATLTSNGKAWSGSFSPQGTVTVTFADNWTVVGSLSLGTSNLTTTLNGAFTVTCGGGISMNGNAVINGTLAGITLNGTGTLTGGVGAGHDLRIPVTVNTSGTVTFATTTFFKFGNSFTYVAGTVVTTGSTVAFGTSNMTITNGAIQWNVVTFNGNVTYTLADNMTVLGTLTLGISNLSQTFNGNALLARGNVGCATGNSSVTGTTVLTFNTTTSQTVSPGTGSSWNVQLPIVFNASGTVNLSGTLIWFNTTVTYTAGSVNAGTSTLLVTGNTGNDITLNTNGMSWYNIQFNSANNNGAFTCTLNSSLSVTGTLSMTSTGAAVNHTLTFAGTSAWTAANVTSTVQGGTWVFKSGLTYTTTTSAFFAGVSSSHFVFKSNTAGTQAKWTLNQGATQSMAYVNGTDIDSSLGQTVWSMGGVLSNTVNWNLLAAQQSKTNAYLM